MFTLKRRICTIFAAFFCLAILPRPLLAAEAPALSEEQAVRELARDLASVHNLVVAANLAPQIAEYVVVHGIRSDSSRSDSSFFFHQMQVECENMANLRRELYAWRDNEAAKRGVELFRLLPNAALDEIVRSLPRTKDELIAIKGIKEAKFREYGQAILHMIEEYKHLAVLPPSVYQGVSKAADEKAVFTVSTYLDIVNRELSRLSARVRGEVTSFKFQGNALYMGIKDPEDESVLSVFMWNADFVTAGITLLQGMEVLVEGRSEIYKPSGRFNFRAHTIELVGEGALKKAYEELKKKLDAEGLFAPERKKPLPEYPERIGLIT